MSGRRVNDATIHDVRRVKIFNWRQGSRIEMFKFAKWLRGYVRDSPRNAMDQGSYRLHLGNDSLSKSVRSANLAKVAGNRIHHPKAPGLFCQVIGAVGQQVPAADSVVLLSASEIAHLRRVKFLHRCVLL